VENSGKNSESRSKGLTGGDEYLLGDYCKRVGGVKQILSVYEETKGGGVRGVCVPGGWGHKRGLRKRGEVQRPGVERTND